MCRLGQCAVLESHLGNSQALLHADTSLGQFELATSFFRVVLLQHLQVGHAQVSFKQQLS
jgi:hypothetical protein